MPTINELYRSFRVGNTLTLANTDLGPEKARGPEVAYTFRQRRWSARAIFYTTDLAGAIYNRTLSSTPALIQRVRTNGDVRAIGSELELEARLTPILSVTTSWALNNSTFTSGELDGKQVPQVPHVQGAIGLRANAGHLAGSIDFRVIGDQYDDDRNDFLLNSGSLFDARGAWRLTKGIEVFGAIENAFDEELDTGRTPIRTIGLPRTARAGLNLRILTADEMVDGGGSFRASSQPSRFNRLCGRSRVVAGVAGVADVGGRAVASISSADRGSLWSSRQCATTSGRSP